MEITLELASLTVCANFGTTAPLNFGTHTADIGQLGQNSKLKKTHNAPRANRQQGGARGLQSNIVEHINEVSYVCVLLFSQKPRDSDLRSFATHFRTLSAIRFGADHQVMHPNRIVCVILLVRIMCYHQHRFTGIHSTFCWELPKAIGKIQKKTNTPDVFRRADSFQLCGCVCVCVFVVVALI